MPPRRKQSARTTPRPTKVTFARIKHILTQVGGPVIERPDKSLMTLTDNSVLVINLHDQVLRVSMQWMSKAPIALELPLSVVADAWNASGAPLTACVIATPQEDGMRLCGVTTLPVSAGLTDDQLGHYLTEAIESCLHFEGFLEETFPQTRFDALAEDGMGLLQAEDEADPGMVPPEIAPAEIVSQLADQARAVMDQDTDEASALLMQASQIVESTGIDPLATGLSEAMAALMERLLETPEIKGTKDAEIGRGLLETLKREMSRQEDPEAVEQDEPEALLRDLLGEQGAGSPGAPAVTLPRLLEALRPSFDVVEQDGQAIIALPGGEGALRVRLVGSDLEVEVRWDDPEWNPELPAPILFNSWNTSAQILALHTESIDEPEPLVPPADPLNTSGAAFGLPAPEEVLPREPVATARWCVDSGATKAQLAAMIDAAYLEALEIADYCFVDGEGWGLQDDEEGAEG